MKWAILCSNFLLNILIIWNSISLDPVEQIVWNFVCLWRTLPSTLPPFLETIREPQAELFNSKADDSSATIKLQQIKDHHCALFVPSRCKFGSIRMYSTQSNGSSSCLELCGYFWVPGSMYVFIHLKAETARTGGTLPDSVSVAKLRKILFIFRFSSM